MLKLGVITDEVSQNIDEVLAFCKEFKLDAVELRSVEGKKPFDWTLDDVKCFAQRFHEAGLVIACISAPLFKCDINDEETIRFHVESFRRLAQFCKVLDTHLIRGFDFWNTGAPLAQRVAQYAPIIEICEEYDITCLLEYDPSVHSNTAALVRETVDAIGSKRVRALFDPGNGVFSDPNCVPFPNDYEVLKPLLRHIHIKDALPTADSAQAVCIGTGKVGYAELFKQLDRDGYEGYCMLETHYRLETQLTDEQFRLPGGAAFSSGAYAASHESMSVLRGLIDM